MTVRKQMTLITGVIILLAVVIYSVISALYVQRYFSGYVEGEYEQTVERIKEMAANILLEKDSQEKQYSQTLSVYIGGLIGEISVLDEEGELVAGAREAMPMMRSPMMGLQRSEKDYFDIMSGGETIGTLIIERTSAIKDSQTVFLFRRALITGAVISGAVALLASIILIVYAGSKMTKDLRLTAEAAGLADTDVIGRLKPSKISEIRAIQSSLEDLSAKLRLQRRARREKADQLSHEVRTPLSILKTNCEGARDKVIEMDEDRLEGCLAEINHLAKILDTITDIIEYDGGQTEISKEEFGLAELLTRINQGFKLQFDRKGINLSYEGEKHLKISTDKALLSQAVYNLVSNAYKFTPVGGQVKVFARKGETSIEIKVCDSGPGVPETEKEKIFEAYHRGAAGKDSPGEGLGLYIARSNVEKLGGEITVLESPLGGACFAIELPEEKAK